MKVDELIKKYNLEQNSYCSDLTPNNPKFYDDAIQKEQDLQNKYRDRIAKGYYGICMGTPTPSVFYDVIDEFLEYVAEKCPDFKICQTKLKFGSLRLYIEGVTQEIQQECYFLEKVLFDEKLIY